jgi:hypothetical protein
MQWGRIMRQLTETRRLGLLDAVRMFALSNLANIDATVAVWYAKQYYDFWRPFHAIRFADTDGNPLTEADPNWVSEHIVPRSKSTRRPTRFNATRSNGPCDRSSARTT